MIITPILLNTIALLLSLKVDIDRSEKISDLSLLLLAIWLLESVLSKFYGIFYQNNIVFYNFLTHILVAINFYIFRSGKLFKFYLLPIIWLISIPLINLIYFDDGLFIKSYLVGLIFLSIYVLNYFRILIFERYFDTYYRDYKIYLGIGIIIFLSCSFPMLYFWFSLTVSGGAKGIFMKLLQTGNIFLSFGYLAAAIVYFIWKPLLK